MEVIVKKHGETRRGVFWCEGLVGNMRFICWQANTKRLRMDYCFYPYDPDFNPWEAFGKEGISALRKETKKAWMRIKQPTIDHIKVDAKTKEARIVLKTEVDPPSCRV